MTRARSSMEGGAACARSGKPSGPKGDLLILADLLALSADDIEEIAGTPLADAPDAAAKLKMQAFIVRSLSRIAQRVSADL